MSSSLAANCGSRDNLNCRTRCGCNPCARQIRCTEETLMPTALAITVAVQWVVSPGGSVSVRATVRSRTASGSGGMREGPGLVSHQAIDALGFETLAPAVDRVPALSALPHDPAGAQTVGRQQHDPRPPYVLLRAVAICHHRLQPAAVAGTQCNPLAHSWPPSYPHARIAECEPIR